MILPTTTINSTKMAAATINVMGETGNLKGMPPVDALPRPV